MIVVCPLNSVEEMIDARGAASVVSLLGPESPHRSFRRIDVARHLKLTFHDIVEPMEGFMPPTREHAERILGFVREWDRRKPMVVHCFAGISRSTASAYAALCALNPDADEAELAWRLREASPTATPNRLLVLHADRLLGRRGRMVSAIESIGRGEDAFEGTPFALDL